MSSHTLEDLIASLHLMGADAIDIRDTLPTHPSKSYPQRDPSKVQGVVFHHSAAAADNGAGIDRAIRMARYTVDHRGWPGCPYSAIVTRSGRILLPWDPDVACYHAGWKPRPGDENAEFLGVCVLGNFRSEHNGSDRQQQPTLHQIEAVIALVRALYMVWPSWPLTENRGLWAHADLGKAACPGSALEHLVKAARWKGTT